MSSRKERQSTRKVEPPDWASDVKPDKDVMAMFYAPTGQPKVGPLIPLSPSAPDLTSDNLQTPETSSVIDNLEPNPGITPDPDSIDTEIETASKSEMESAEPPENLGELVPKIVEAKTLPPVRQEEELVSDEVTSPNRSAISPNPEPEPESNTEEFKLAREEARDDPNLQSTQPDAGETHFVSSQSIEFDQYFGQWIPFLTKGQAKILRALFEMTYAIGLEECLTSTSQLAAAADMSERQTASVAQDLERLGFLARPETYNTRTRKGTIFRLFLTRQTDSPRVRRRYHLEDH